MPNLNPQKTIHQRNKSSPALSTMAHGGGLKAAAKRTAFADVSNALNVQRPSKDDSVIPCKGNTTVAEKPLININLDKKSAALSRPAQRPLSVSGLKSLLHNVSGSNPQPSAKQPLADTQQSARSAVQDANVKKPVKKKSTAIFKDVTLNEPDQSVAENQVAIATCAPPPTRHDLPPIPDEKEEILVEEPKFEPQSGDGDKSLSGALPSMEEEGAFRSDGIYIDRNGDVQQYVFQDDNEDPKDDARLVLGELENPAHLPSEDKSTVPESYPEHQQEHVQVVTKDTQKRLPASEPEEYFYDDELYEEEGYVTARSFKSRGENTTNGVTTVVFPHVNNKIRKELAAAKELIESTRTVEDIDDETWDTSMVAEYGEEIFGYMRDLEVSLSL